MNPSDQHVTPLPADVAARAPYQTPRLTRLGDLRGLTLGGSSGTGESGNVGLRKP